MVYLFTFKQGEFMQHKVSLLKRVSSPLSEILEEITELAVRVSPHRNRKLFSEFLPMGYRMTTLSSVSEELQESNLFVKRCLGTIITLYDDLADNPELRNPELLKDLYQIPFGRKNRFKAKDTNSLGQILSYLWELVFHEISNFPHYKLLHQAFEFDVLQFFNANRYAELITSCPYLFNLEESRCYLPHNMGIVLVGTVDLMCSNLIDIKSIGSARTLFAEAQRAARMMNMISTADRELAEGDRTNELILAENRGKANLILKKQIQSILHSLQASELTFFSVKDYIQGMESLFSLHKEFQGVI